MVECGGVWRKKALEVNDRLSVFGGFGRDNASVHTAKSFRSAAPKRLALS